VTGRCGTCRWWQTGSKDYHRDETQLEVRDAVTFERVEPQPFELRQCKHPKLRFYERPEIDGAALLDGSEFFATLVAGPHWGCVNHEQLRGGNADAPSPSNPESS
jgi:hypothetical protein